MELRIKRTDLSDESTIGELSVNGQFDAIPWKTRSGRRRSRARPPYRRGATRWLSVSRSGFSVSFRCF